MLHDLSSCRAQLRTTQQQIQDLLEVFLGREPLLPASLYTLRRRCGKPNCHCAHGQLHATTVLSLRGHHRPQTITPPAEHLEEVRQLTLAYRRFRQARTHLLRLQRHMLTLIDRLEAARRQQGQRRWQQRCSSTTPPSSRPSRS